MSHQESIILKPLSDNLEFQDIILEDDTTIHQ